MGMKNFMNSVGLGLPVYSAFFLLLLAAFGGQVFEKINGSPFLVPVSFLGVSFKIYVVKLQIACIVGAFGFICYALIRDYSKFFPKHLSVAISFDNNGISKRIATIPRDFLENDFTFDEEWPSRKKEFFKNVNCEIMHSVREHNIPEDNILQFDTEGDIMSGEGKTTFIIEKISVRQKYKIKEASGDATFSSHEMHNATLQTSFSLGANANSAIVDVSIKQMFFKWGFYIKPVFVQTFSAHPVVKNTIYRNLIVVTPIQFFPFVSIGDSVYIHKSGEKYTPIGYCDYTDQ